MRGNLQCNTETIDCHANANAFARNDKKRRLAVSIAASAIIASISIDSLAAGCGGTNQANHSTVNCSGNMSLVDLWNPYRSIGSTTYNISGLTATDNRGKTLSFQPYPYSPAGGGSNYLNINNTTAGNSSLTVSFDTGNYSQVSVSNTRLGGLTVGGNRSSNSININSSSNIGTLTISSSNSNTNISSSTIGTLNANNWVGTLTVGSSNVSTLNNNNNIGTLNINNSSVSSINNNGGISNLNLQNRARVTNLTNNANKTISNLTITNSSITGKLDNKGTINTLNATSSTISDLTNSNSGRINTLNLNSSSINSLTNQGTIGSLTLDKSSINSFSNTGTITGNLTLQNGSKIDGAVNVGTIKGNLSIIGKSSIGSITGGTIQGNLELGDDRDRGVFSPSLSSFEIKASVERELVVYSASLTLDSSGQQWNASKDGQHITVVKAQKASVADGAIYINIGKAPKPTSDTDNYETKNLVVATGKDATGKDNTISNANDLKFKHIYTTNELISGPGSKLIPLDENNQSLENASRALQQEATKFRLEADVPSSFGAAMYRSLTMGNIRRNIMTQNILDTMTTKTFRSDKFYNQEVELRLLQYEMSRITNRSSKFNKLKRKNEKKLDKVREKMARLTLEQSKGQDIDKGYNNFELLDQLDVAFIPYSGKRDWRLFALPYASHTYGYLASNQVVEYAVGGIFGVQRNLRKNGIFGGYIGYEFGNNDTQLAGRNANILNNSLNGGINYFKTFSIARKVAEGFLKVNVRGGVDFPTMSIADSAAENIRLRSNSKLSSEVLMYNVGAEIKGGVTFYQFRRNSYIAPEIGLSYDMLSTFDNKLLKTHYFLTTGINDEFYDGFMWHLPQISLGVRYYKVVGNKFRFNTKIGAKYNFLNRQKFSATLKEHESGSQELAYKAQTASATSEIALPKVYGNLAFDFIWNVKKNHEISLGYDGLFFFSSFAKDKNIGGPTQDWFNGVTTTVNLKYAYWFGGTDYKTDKDGNVVGSNKAKKSTQSKSKKSKKKKEKKSKKKVYYIDG